MKEAEQKQLGWSVKRELAKINYRIHASAIKQHLIPDELTTEQKSYVYVYQKLNFDILLELRIMNGC